MLATVLRESSLADVVETLAAEYGELLGHRAVCAAVRHARRQLEIGGSAVTLPAIEQVARVRLDGVAFRVRHAV